MSKWRYDSCNCWSADNAYYNATCFKCNGYDYEQDEDNGRCYKLEPSLSLKSEMDGALVRRRISKKEFEARRNECLQAVEKFEQWHHSINADLTA